MIGTAHRLHQTGRVLSVRSVGCVDSAMGLLHNDGQDHAAVDAAVAGHFLNGVVDVFNILIGIAYSTHGIRIALKLGFVSWSMGWERGKRKRNRKRKGLGRMVFVGCNV